MKSYAIGMDIGGTNSVFGIVDREGQVVCCDSIKTQEYTLIDDYIEAVSTRVEALIEKVGGKKNIEGFGIGAPNGNYYKGTIELAPNLPWKGVVIPLCDMFEKRLGIRTRLTNDANAAALGEMTYGVAKGVKNFIMITLGTGVGSGIVVDGKMLYGSTGFAGELGHVTVNRTPQARLCGCGRRGCLETYCSATGIARTARERVIAMAEPSLLRELDVMKITSKDIYDAAVKGDAMAISIFRETGTILGRALADMVVFSSPEMIVLFGGLAKAGDYILKYAEEAMDENLLPIFKGTVKLVLSGLKDADAAVLGASALGWKE
ncbi:MAG: ROK family protein [Bacteroidales bacterium]|nr:ROK family protein [Bacteroidales bacterium]